MQPVRRLVSVAAAGSFRARLPGPWRCVVAELPDFLTVRVAEIFRISPTTATRAAKDPEATPENLVDGWRAKAKSHGLDDHVLAALHRREHCGPPALGSPSAEDLFVRLAAPDGLTSRRSTFGRAEVLEAIGDRLPGGGRAVDIVSLGDAFLASHHVIPIDPPQPAPTEQDRSTTAWL